MSWKKYRFSWMLARRDILEEKKISLIVVAMLSFSFLNLVFFPAFISGLSDAFTSTIVETQTGHVLIEPDNGRLTNVDALEKKIQSFEEVRDVEKRLRFTATITYQGETKTGVVFGTDHLTPFLYQDEVRTGDLLNTDNDGNIMLGNFIAEDDTLLGSGDGIGAGTGSIVTVQAHNTTDMFKVEGTIGRPGPSPLPDQSFISYSDAENILDVTDEADSVKIHLEDGVEPATFKQKLLRLNTKGDINTWREVSDLGTTLEDTFSIVTYVVSLVGVIIAVTSIGVVIFINSSKRKREMGIVRSIGSQRSQILQTYLLESVIFGLIGTVIGALLMLGIHNYLTANPIPAPVGDIKTILTADLILSRSVWMIGSALVAGFLPAYIVANQNIIDAIEAR